MGNLYLIYELFCLTEPQKLFYSLLLVHQLDVAATKSYQIKTISILD